MFPDEWELERFLINSADAGRPRDAGVPVEILYIAAQNAADLPLKSHESDE